MKFTIFVFNNFYKFLLFLAIFFVFAGFIFIVKGSTPPPNRKINLTIPYSFDGLVDIIIEDGDIYHKKVPFSITTDKNFHIVLNLDGMGMCDDKTLSFISKSTTMRCEVDGKVIYRHFKVANSLKYAQNNSLFLIKLPKTIKNNIITLYYENTNPYPSAFEFKKVRIAKYPNIIFNYFLSDSILEYLLLLSMFIIFVSAIFSTNLLINPTKIEKYYIYIGFLSFSIFTYILFGMPLIYFILNEYDILLSISVYTSLMFMPIFLIYALMQRTSRRTHLYFKFILILLSLNVIVQYVFVFLDIKTFNMMVNYTYILILFALALSIYSFIFIIRKKDEENRAKIRILSLSFLLVGIGYEVIQSVIKSYILFSDTFKICILFFAILQWYDFFSFYMLNKDKKIKAKLYQKLAFIDKLTNLGNRLALSEKRIDYYKTKKSFYIILLDINNLKYVNDKYGHKYGDCIIKLLSDMLKKEFGDIYGKDLFRIGGDEFVIIYHCPKNIDLESKLSNFAQVYAQSKIEGMEENYFGVSYGFSYCDMAKGDDFSKIMHIADKNMYENKLKKKEIKKS